MRERIYDGALKVIRKRGLKFTMDELAAELGMSKKTIYKNFHDKKEMLYGMIDYVFDEIKKGEEAILRDTDLPTGEKLKRILSVLPDEFSGMDLSMMYLFSEKYPKHYERIVERLENGWDMTWEVLDQGIAEGIFRPVNHHLFKLMFGAAVERILKGDDLEKMGVSYVESLNTIVDILIDGIKTQETKP